MKTILSKIFKSTIKTRIMVIFSLIALILVGSMAFISYQFVRTIYLEQIEDQIIMMNNVLANDLNQTYLDYIQSDSDNMASLYYQKKINEANTIMDLNNIFLFNGDFEILVKAANEISPARLKLNREEIDGLKISGNVVSMPFKADDGNWYVWGFHRLTDRYYLGIQEGAERLQRLDSLALLFIGIAVFGLSLTFLAAWLVARAIASPINQLVKFSGEIGHGNYQSDPPAEVTGELAVLGNALINMRNGILQHQEEKEKLLAEIAHEIRNPLGGVELLAGLIKENLPGDNQNTDYADKIIKEIQGLKQQVNDFLQFSRSAPARPVSLNLNDIIVEIQNLYKKQLEHKNISLVWENNLTDLKFDLSHMRQILMNLISNSINVLEENGKIWIYANHNGKHSYISVSDNGPGVAENELKEIFEPFYSKRTGGTGLGLAICRKLCAENNSRITAENNKKAGCTFTIEI